MKKLTLIILSAIIILNLSGCATYFTRAEFFGPRSANTIYPATQTNGMIVFLSILNFPVHPIRSTPLFALNTVDLPVSIITDTFFLSTDIDDYNRHHNGSSKSSKKKLVYKKVERIKQAHPEIKIDKEVIRKKRQELLDKNINFDEILSSDDSVRTNENYVLVTLQ